MPGIVPVWKARDPLAFWPARSVNTEVGVGAVGHVVHLGPDIQNEGLIDFGAHDQGGRPPGGDPALGRFWNLRHHGCAPNVARQQGPSQRFFQVEEPGT